MSVGICSNCFYEQSCCFKSTNPVIHCEIHYLYGKESRIDAKKIGLNEEPLEMAQGKSICISCRFMKNCSLRKKDIVINQCEEFQN